MAKKFHPDRYKGNIEIFKKITEAYNILRDPHKREEYNRRMKFQMKAKFKNKKEKENDMFQEKSKYDEEFSKLNVDQLFSKFTHQIIKSDLSEIKVHFKIINISQLKVN
jgi:curved DNA-binding protein CbpA